MAKLPLAKVVPGVEVTESDLRDAASNGRGVLRTVRGTYDVTGGASGATGAHDLVDENGEPVTVPADAIVVAGGYDVQTTFTSGNDSATLQLELDDADGNDDDLVAAVAISNGANAWDQGRHAVIPDWATVGDWIKPTTERRLRVTVGTQTVTGGKLTAFAVYFASE
jgi:hypothetical protein